VRPPPRQNPKHQAETAAGSSEPEPAQEIERTDLNTAAGTWPEPQAEIIADIDPEALIVMASANADMAVISRSEIDDNLARAQAGAEQLAAQRAHNQAERDRAAIDEPVNQAETQPELEAAADAVDLEI
jgi:hypothetical protein